MTVQFFIVRMHNPVCHNVSFLKKIPAYKKAGILFYVSADTRALSPTKTPPATTEYTPWCSPC